jgi:lipoprotein-anchoring transpeptidase ErfK/SrfK
MSMTRRRALTALGLAGAGVAGVAGLAACTGDKSPIWNGSTGDGDKPAETPPKATVTISGPAADAKNVPASAEIVFAATEAVQTTVSLKDANGAEVPGAMHPDGAGWLPEKALAFGATYTATVTATGDDGKPATATSTFTTMAKPTKLVGISSFLADNAVIGVGMVLIFKTSRDIAKADRAAVQRRLMVETQPLQEGIWTWYTARELHWRPKTFWQAGTQINVTVRAGGLPMGGGYYGRRDSTLVCKVGPDLQLRVDDKTHKMTVHKDGKVIKTIPVSLGRPTMPSSSGTMIIIEKKRNTVFDTMDAPNPANRYRTPVEYQGRRNVSHGCVNVSMANAAWLFANTLVGTPITTKGTPRELDYGNGWTDWDKTWEQYVKGSAIPYVPPADPAPDPSTTPSTDPSATPSPAVSGTPSA